jgi:hypothetical protein
VNVVLDVNVWISGLLWGGLPGQVIQLAHSQHITSYVSAELLLELETTLNRPKFQTRLQQRNLTVVTLIELVTALSTIISIKDMDIPELRDPADTKILATAIATNAQALITGDQDLLVLKQYQGVTIQTPDQFLNLMDAQS